MKKTLSVFLAVLLLAVTAAPAFAAGGGYTVEFVQPSSTLETVDGNAPYCFVKSENGIPAYGLVENGAYVFFNNKVTAYSNIFEPEQYDFTEFYGPMVYSGAYDADAAAGTKTQAGPLYPIGSVAQFEEGEIVSFFVLTNEVYNAASAMVYVNGEFLEPETNGEYRVYVDRDLQIAVKEDDGAGNMLLQRNMFTVKLPSGDGYSARPLEGQNYALVPYGGSFTFRVKITKGYTDAGMTVKYTSGSMGLEKLLGEDVSGIIGMLPAGELTEEAGLSIVNLSSTGVDSNGYRIYTIDNITADCSVAVSGVREESSSGLLATLKRILRLILDFFGIKLDILGSITDIFDVTVNSSDSERITYAVTSGASESEISPSAFNVCSGDSVTIEVSTTWAECDKHVNVSWTYTDEEGNAIKTVNGGSYNSEWQIRRNPATGAIYYTRIFVIDNITSDVVISISEI